MVIRSDLKYVAEKINDLHNKSVALESQEEDIKGR